MVGNKAVTTPTLTSKPSPENNTLNGGKEKCTEQQLNYCKGDTALQQGTKNLPVRKFNWSKWSNSSSNNQ